MTALLFFLVVLGVYLSLALLPKGRTAAMGLGVAAVVAIIAGQIAVFAPLAPLLGYAIALAAMVQGLRHIFGARLPEGMYRALLGAPPFLLAAWVLIATSIGAG